MSYTFADTWSGMIQKVVNGEAHVIASLAISGERRKNLAFTEVIHSSAISILVRSQTVTIGELRKGMSLGTTTGGIPYEYIKKFSGLDITLYRTFPEALFGLLAGEVDAFVGATLIFLKVAGDAGVDDRIKIVGRPLLNIKRAVAVRRDNPRLLARLNTAIAGLVESPEYRNTYVRWYGKPKASWTPRRILLVMSAMIVISISGMALWRHRTVLKLNRTLMENINERQKAEQTM